MKSLLTVGAILVMTQWTWGMSAVTMQQRDESTRPFEGIAAVMSSPRCANCHFAGDAPGMGDESRFHGMVVRRADLAIYVRRHGAIGLFAGVVAAAGFLAYLVAAQSLPLGPVSAVRETSVIFGAVLGTVVLKEGFGMRRIAAALLVTAGIMLLAIMR